LTIVAFLICCDIAVSVDLVGAKCLRTVLIRWSVENRHTDICYSHITWASKLINHVIQQKSGRGAFELKVGTKLNGFIINYNCYIKFLFYQTRQTRSKNTWRFTKRKHIR